MPKPSDPIHPFPSVRSSFLPQCPRRLKRSVGFTGRSVMCTTTCPAAALGTGLVTTFNVLRGFIVSNPSCTITLDILLLLLYVPFLNPNAG